MSRIKSRFNFGCSEKYAIFGTANIGGLGACKIGFDLIELIDLKKQLVLYRRWLTQDLKTTLSLFIRKLW